MNVWGGLIAFVKVLLSRDWAEPELRLLLGIQCSAICDEDEEEEEHTGEFPLVKKTTGDF